MSTPKTTPFTLKRIVENLGKIPDKGFGQDETPKLSAEQKKKLMEMASMFEDYGESLRNEEAIVNSARAMTELCELAEAYALNECGDWFQQDIVKRDMKEVKKRVMEYGKLAKECYAKMQQLGVAYQDIGHVLGRYYDLKKKASSNVGPARSLDRTQEDVTLTELTENHWEDRAKEIGQKPQVPVLSPEEKQATVAAYRALPQDRKDLFKRLIQHPCAYCEKEFNVPNVGLSHGICERHKKEQYAQMGMMDKYKPNPNNQTVDLKELSPEELKLAVNLFAIVRAKEKDKLAKRTDLAKAA